MNTRSSSLAQG